MVAFVARDGLHLQSQSIGSQVLSQIQLVSLDRKALLLHLLTTCFDQMHRGWFGLLGCLLIVGQKGAKNPRTFSSHLIALTNLLLGGHDMWISIQGQGPAEQPNAMQRSFPLLRGQ
tara:strand:- start:3568 stop:3915 length:348 start_codon:yes stop_codon:yes gene_type:complete